jgi:hypothetical protein
MDEFSYDKKSKKEQLKLWRKELRMMINKIIYSSNCLRFYCLIYIRRPNIVHEITQF